jgi:hypothetical protein
MGFLLGSDPARGIGINLLPVLGHFDRLTERGEKMKLSEPGFHPGTCGLWASTTVPKASDRGSAQRQDGEMRRSHRGRSV